MGSPGNADGVANVLELEINDLGVLYDSFYHALIDRGVTDIASSKG